MAIAVSYWLKSLQNGEPFSEALRGWAPPSERLMLSVGDVSHLDQALENLIRVTEGVKRMIGPIIEATSYPAFLFCLVLLILWAIGVYMVPPMIDAAPNVRWTGVAKTLVDLSEFVQDKWWVLIVFPIVLFTVLILSMPRWKNRYRVYVENVPPWSLYRVFTGVSWLLALAALVKAGTPVSKALRNLTNDASPYVVERVNKALVYITNGDNLGEALYKTKYNFPDKEIIGDLRIYSELDNFALALDQISNEWLNESEQAIATKAAVLNTVAILMVSGIVAWSVWGTFDMQDQLVKAMGMT
ncbi:MAG: Toxin coregulated pilus biosynthesis protein E [Alphaproteobacteria bacterium ADurb.Bin438]|nr:MAG: Toxin coregulated pilus biosynthesis protein E [Alphaproteobacteria bacterium ADurb.Bin438]